ncbi:MAG TPA: MerR family transcriptional regulator [Hyphomicrobiaceae bacterium]|nr:MerR family transcriptional regulator [Hyphomicrobiaceae bacterium]
MSKAAEAFRNISEVAQELGVKKHVLRFWEVKFPQIKPMKRGGGRRLYRPADVELLKAIRNLLQNAGYKIEGVQRLLREQGIEQVKLAGAGCATGATRDRTRRPAQPSPDTAPSVRLSAAEFGVLRSIAAELDTCRTMLAGVVAVVTPDAHERVA